MATISGPTDLSPATKYQTLKENSGIEMSRKRKSYQNHASFWDWKYHVLDWPVRFVSDCAPTVCVEELAKE